MSGGGRFLTRGLRRVKAEAALSVLAFNISRASNAFGTGALMSRGLEPRSIRFASSRPHRVLAEFLHSLGVSPQKGSAETTGSAAGEGLPLPGFPRRVHTLPISGSVASNQPVQQPRLSFPLDRKSVV